ncbi:hypothetical protein ACJJTC_017190 [Scirpophaga incertulas]
MRTDLLVVCASGPHDLWRALRPTAGTFHYSYLLAHDYRMDGGWRRLNQPAPNARPLVECLTTMLRCKRKVALIFIRKLGVCILYYNNSNAPCNKNYKDESSISSKSLIYELSKVGPGIANAKRNSLIEDV